MRTIKFRAWHTEIKKMFSPEELGQDEMTISVDGRGFVNVSSVSPRLSQYITEMIPMQYTGLLDKNGKELYEGDICMDVDGHISSIYWDHSRWKFWVEDCLECYNSAVKLEVIGNIHENPELLK